MNDKALAELQLSEKKSIKEKRFRGIRIARAHKSTAGHLAK